ncbi:MAG: hypothetical protein HYT10_02860 [Candidatus Levybacteria bacterium]|nr:hypothetical protein [Candidatus Levybacteria bacterium]
MTVSESEPKTGRQEEAFVENAVSGVEQALDTTKSHIEEASEETREVLHSVFPEIFQSPRAAMERLGTEMVAKHIIDAQISYAPDGIYDTDLPFAIATHPYVITEGEAKRIEADGQAYKDFLNGLRDLYIKAGQEEELTWVRETLERGKSEQIVTTWQAEQLQPIAPFFRPDITRSEDGREKTVELVQMIGGWGLLTGTSEAYTKTTDPEDMRIVGDSPAKHYVEMVKAQAEKMFAVNEIAVLVDEPGDLPEALAKTIEKQTSDKDSEGIAEKRDCMLNVVARDDIQVGPSGYSNKKTGEPILSLQLTNPSQEEAFPSVKSTFVAGPNFLKGLPRMIPEGKDPDISGYLKSIKGKTVKHCGPDIANFQVAIVVSRELGKYKRELTHFAKACRVEGASVACVYSDEVRVEDGKARLSDGQEVKAVHRFFQTYNLTDAERQILDAVDLIYPRSNSFLEEKSTMALLFDNRLERYWEKKFGGAEKFRKIKEMFAETHMVNASEPMTLNGKSIAWHDLLLMSKNQRLAAGAPVVKVSGADGHLVSGEQSDSWGARGVTTPLEDDVTYRSYIVKALKSSDPDRAFSVVAKAMETADRTTAIHLLEAYCNNIDSSDAERAHEALGELVDVYQLYRTGRELSEHAAAIRQKAKQRGEMPDTVRAAVETMEQEQKALADRLREHIQPNTSLTQWMKARLIDSGIENPDAIRPRNYVYQEFIKSELFYVRHLDPGSASKLAADNSKEPRRVRTARFHARFNPFYIDNGKSVKLAGIGVTFSQTTNQKSHLARSAILAPAAIAPMNF